MRLRIIALFLTFPCLCSVRAQEKPEQIPTCNVAITSPRSGDRVSDDGTVKGTATMPLATHLWVFAHRRGLGLWWPQGGGQAQIRDGKWSVLVTYGLPRDAGNEFEVAAGIFDDTENKKLLSWIRKAEETGQYPGMHLPESVEGCPTQVLIVTKEN